jgi:hypothetical protein
MARWIGLAFAVGLTAALPGAGLAQGTLKSDGSPRTIAFDARRHARPHGLAWNAGPYQPRYYAQPVYYRPYPYAVPFPFVFGFGPWW